MIRFHWVYCIVCVFICFSCGKDKERRAAVFEDTETSDVNFEEPSDIEEVELEDDVVSIPFKEQGGVKTVEVNINDAIGVDMIVDTGCSGALISLSEARYLAEKGALSPDDIIGSSKSMIADGSIVENTVVVLRKLTIGGKLEATDVEATVSENISAPLLLGNEVLGRVKSISIDNDNKCILFKLR